MKLYYAGEAARARRSLDYCFTLLEISEEPPQPVMPVKTSASHLAGLPMPQRAEGEVKRVDFEVTPQGNGVVLEDQMIKLADNQMEYEAAANLYQRGLSLLRTAISRR